MTLSELEGLIAAGRLKREPPDQAEFDGLVQLGEAKLNDSRTASLSLAGRFELAYGASHSFALAALRWHGYRSDQRYIVFQTVQHTLGLPADVWRVLDKAHGTRNLADYGGQLQVTERLFKDLLAAATIVRDAVLRMGPIQSQA
jgi:hypothetical protein